MPDTSRTLIVEGSPTKLLGLVSLGVLMTALSIMLAVLPDARIADFARIWGYAGAAFFGLCTGIAFWRLFTAPRAVITISPEGICDTRVAAELIPWSAITGISTWQYGHQKIMVLAMKPGVEDRLGLTRVARWTRSANRALGADGLCVTAVGLKIDYDTLLHTSLGYYARASGRGSARREQLPSV